MQRTKNGIDNNFQKNRRLSHVSYHVFNKGNRICIKPDSTPKISSKSDNCSTFIRTTSTSSLVNMGSHTSSSPRLDYLEGEQIEVAQLPRSIHTLTPIGHHLTSTAWTNVGRWFNNRSPNRSDIILELGLSSTQLQKLAQEVRITLAL